MIALYAVIGALVLTAPPPLQATPSRALHRCRASPLLRPACPPRIPKVDGRLTVGLSAINLISVFDLQHGVPHDRDPRRSAPPHVLHLTVVAGRPSVLMAGMRYPGARRTARPRNGIVAIPRTKPLLFGRRRWSGRTGALFLAPPFPVGGQMGNHLVFWWRAHHHGYAIGLHSWEPFAQTVRTLRAIVGSLASP